MRTLVQGAFDMSMPAFIMLHRRSWEWIDDQTFVCRERTMSPDQKRLYSREVVVAATRGVVRDQFYSERLYDRAELVDLLGQIGFEIETGQTAEHLADDVLDTVTTARELSQRGQDLGMMEQRLLIIARKVRDEPSASKRIIVEPEPVETEEQLQRTALNATVRELIEKFRESVVAEEYNDRNLADIICKDEEGNAMPLLDLPPSLSGRSSPVPKTLISPASYHLLPPPPFPDGQLTVIMGDTNLPCREKLNGVWNLEDFDTRSKFIKALLDCGYTPDQVRT